MAEPILEPVEWTEPEPRGLYAALVERIGARPAHEHDVEREHDDPSTCTGPNYCAACWCLIPAGAFACLLPGCPGTPAWYDR